MSEVLSTIPERPSVEAPTTSQSAPETYRGRLRRGLSEVGGRLYSLLDVSAGIALTKGDIRTTETTMDSLNQRYDGLIGRHAGADVSMSLQEDITLDFRRDAQRAGFTDVDQMPADERLATAEAAALSYTYAIAAELRATYPDWSDEEITTAAEGRARDIGRLLSMDAAERDTYQAAMFEYQEARSTANQLRTELAELRTQRNERVAAIGSVAVRGVMNAASKVGNLPRAVAARATHAGIDAAHNIREWYDNSNPESKKRFFLSAAGVAITGIATYIAVRLNAGTTGGGSGGEQNVQFALMSDTSFKPEQIGASFSPTHIGETFEPHAIGGAFAPEEIGASFKPTEIGAPFTPTEIGGSFKPEDIGGAAFKPTEIGGDPFKPTEIGEPFKPTEIGDSAIKPERIGGGLDLSGAHTSQELFGHTQNVTNWPDTIVVSPWDSSTKDGSLWGISETLLQRSGVTNPSDPQVAELVDALRPQAQPNGHLLKGQVLDLRPATSLLPKKS